MTNKWAESLQLQLGMYRNAFLSSNRNFDCAILHLRNMVFALYHHLCHLFIQKGCSPNSQTYVKKKEADFFQKLAKNFHFFTII